MARVSEQEIRRAREVGVLDYLRRYEPDELVRVGTRDYRTKTHDSLIISENGLFHWFSHAVGGNCAIDYLLKVKNMDFVSAVRLLNEGMPEISSFQTVNSHSVHMRQREEFTRPQPDSGNEAIKAYLYRRGISSKVFHYCYNSGILLQTTRGGNKNCVFLGLDESGEPKSAFVRGCNGNWRGDLTGSQKKYGFCIPASDLQCGTVEIYEAPIDAMSGATLRQLRKQEDWRSVHYLSMGGLNYQAAEWFLERHDIKKVRLCLDNDKRGIDFAERLVQKLRSQGYDVENTPPVYGKDYNDLLIYEMRAKVR